jgi:hypothetical protein
VLQAWLGSCIPRGVMVEKGRVSEARPGDAVHRLPASCRPRSPTDDAHAPCLRNRSILSPRTRSAPRPPRSTLHAEDIIRGNAGRVGGGYQLETPDHAAWGACPTPAPRAPKWDRGRWQPGAKRRPTKWMPMDFNRIEPASPVSISRLIGLAWHKKSGWLTEHTTQRVSQPKETI